jgi:hypothetical protein
MLRQNNEARWPHGVLSGGTVIDMLEYLSITPNTSDYALVLWLETHYIEPCGRIERLDGIVVTNEVDWCVMCLVMSFNLALTVLMRSAILAHCYERYIELQGENTRAQKLWVAGLEPTHHVPSAASISIPGVPRNTEYKKWKASDMYYKNGLEVERKARFESSWVDTNRWDRTIWSVPDVEKVVSKQAGVNNTPTIRESIEVPVAPGTRTSAAFKNDELRSDTATISSLRPSTTPTLSSQSLSPAKSGSSRTLSPGTQDTEFTLEDISDPRLRYLTVRLDSIFPHHSVRERFDALIEKDGHWDDAADLLADEENHQITQTIDAQSKTKAKNRETAKRKSRT